MPIPGSRALLTHTHTGWGQWARGRFSYHVGKQYMKLIASLSLSRQLPPVGVLATVVSLHVKLAKERGTRFCAAIRTTPMCGSCESWSLCVERSGCRQDDWTSSCLCHRCGHRVSQFTSFLKRYVCKSTVTFRIAQWSVRFCVLLMDGLTGFKVLFKYLFSILQIQIRSDLGIY